MTGFVDKAVEEGAKIETGGKRFVPTDPHLENGFYFSPTIMTNCRDNMEVVQEEIFGAVVTILPFDTEEEVLTRANNTRLGLAGGIFTKYIKFKQQFLKTLFKSLLHLCFSHAAVGRQR